MFPASYFAPVYWAPTYFPDPAVGGQTTVTPGYHHVTVVPLYYHTVTVEAASP